MAIYADNAATTQMSETAIAVMTDCLRHQYGNPSSLYTIGQKAKEALEEARCAIAAAINADPKEIIFTSGGSEADNQALLSAALNGKQRGKTHIISTAFEHHAVLHTLNKLAQQGFEITLLPVHENGIVDTEELKAAIREDTCLVTVMTANNEIGTIQPIAEIGAVCRERKIPCHPDAVQAVGHVPVDVQAMQIDLLTLTAHKFHGPKGVGAVYIRKGVRVPALVQGGSQENKKRAGTENIPGIVGLAAALQYQTDHMAEHMAYMTRLRDKLMNGIEERIPTVELNGHRTQRLPNNVNFCLRYIESESVLLWLDVNGIAASSGSACTSGSLDPSHVLLAMGVSHEAANGSLRLTLSELTTEEEIDYTLDVLPQIVQRLRDMSPIYPKGE